MCRHPEPSPPRCTQHTSLLADDHPVSLGRGQEPRRAEEQEGEGLLGDGASDVAPAGQSDGLAQAHGDVSVDSEYTTHSGEFANC